MIPSSEEATWRSSTYCRRNVAPATIATPFAVDFDCGRTRMLPRPAETVRDERAKESERMPQMALVVGVGE